jgi:hypothetical protein
MLSGTLLTKVTLQHLLYQNGEYISQKPSDTNYFSMVPNPINNPVNEVSPRIDVPDYDSGLSGESDDSIDVMYHEGYPSRNRMWSSKKNTAGF